MQVGTTENLDESYQIKLLQVVLNLIDIILLSVNEPLHVYD